VFLWRDGSQLVAGSNDGKIHFWDFAGAVKAMHDFEAALER
jgi:hypothetical protein